MPDLDNVYRRQAAQYERMIQCEDYQGNLIRAVQAIRPLDGLDVIEFGAGTGRMTRLLAPHVRSIHAFDRSYHMLSEAARRLPEFGVARPSLAIADHRQMPVPSNSADLVIQGWSFLHVMLLYPETWQHEMMRAHREMTRILRPGGTIVHIETLGTGHTSPFRHEDHSPLYEWWEHELGFSHNWLRTDYRFPSKEVAAELTVFFFGEAIMQTFLPGDVPILPECTGLWWQTAA